MRPRQATVIDEERSIKVSILAYITVAKKKKKKKKKIVGCQGLDIAGRDAKSL